MERLREAFYMGLVSLAIGLLWATAWAGSLNGSDRRFVPAAHHPVYFEADSELDAELPQGVPAPTELTVASFDP